MYEVTQKNSCFYAIKFMMLLEDMHISNEVANYSKS